MALAVRQARGTPETAIFAALGLGFLVGKLTIKGIALGPVAGANTPSLGAITDTARSQIPVLGHTIPCAIGNVLLTIWGALIVAVLA